MKKTKLRLGIDVGGTNTDGVLMSGSEVLGAHKSFTTDDISGGVISTVSELLQGSGVPAGNSGSVMIGTTQFVNAFLQRRHLSEVAVVRICLPKSDGVPPMVAWPDDLRAIIGSHIYLVGGGSFYTGLEYAPLDEDELDKVGRDIAKKGLNAIVITANFAPVRPDIEERAASILRRHLPNADITLSAQVGGMGLIDRENAAIINAALSQLSRKVVTSLVSAFQSVGINAPIYISQNDGTLISTEYAQRFPIFTCSAGPTNSIRGAAFLTGLQEAVVVDIGGTTTDVGFLLRGFPRETATANTIGGVRTNFRMPDVLSIALGGGTVVRQSATGITLGPDSVGYQLKDKGMIFGGDTLTTTDIAVRAGQFSLGDRSKVAGLPDALVGSVLDIIHARIEVAIDQMKTNSRPVPVVLVGGGAILVSRPLKGASQVYQPEYAEVANAIGAAIALVSGRVDRLFDVGALGREGALAQAKGEAIAAAVAAGADPDSVQIVDVVELPMTHMKSGSVQIKVRAVGELADE